MIFLIFKIIIRIFMLITGEPVSKNAASLTSLFMLYLFF